MTTPQGDIFDRVVERAARAYGVHASRIVHAPSRGRLDYAEARRAVCYVLREEHGWTLTAIGRALGRDHSSVHHAWQQATRRLNADPTYVRTISWIAESPAAPEGLAAYVNASRAVGASLELLIERTTAMLAELAKANAEHRQLIDEAEAKLANREAMLDERERVMWERAS